MENLYYERESNKPATGIGIDYHNNGEVKVRGEIKVGKKDGIWEYFYDNGKLEQREKWKAHEADGLFEYFYENGQLIKTKVF